MKKAIFLDRDGTINVDKGYVHRVEDFEFMERVPEAIAWMKQLGYLVIVLSNQSGVARGFFREQDVECLHRYINERLAEYGTGIDAFYYCPHHPQAVVETYRRECNCRKPGTGLLLQALQDYSIDLEKSWVVGDRERDLFLQCDAPLGRVLLKTECGDGKEQKNGYLSRKSLWDFTQMDL